MNHGRTRRTRRNPPESPFEKGGQKGISYFGVSVFGLFVHTSRAVWFILVPCRPFLFSAIKEKHLQIQRN